MKKAYLVVLCLLVLTGISSGVSTKAWKITNMDDFMLGEMKSLVAGSDGALTVGPEFSRVELKTQVAYSVLRLKSGDILVGTGNDGKVLKVSRKGELSEVLDTEAMIITGLTQNSDGSVIVSTMPNGEVFLFNPSNSSNSKVLTTLKDDGYIWVTAVGRDGSIYAGTGPNGKIFKISAKTGKAEEIFKAPASHILSLVIGSEGELYAGTSEKGLLYRIETNGRARVLNDFDEEEVSAIALRGNKELVVALNSTKTRPDAGMPPPRKGPPPKNGQQPPKDGPGMMDPMMEGPPGGRPGGGDLGSVTSAIYKIDENGLVRNFARLPNTFIGDLKVGKDGSIYVATGDDGRVFKILDGDTSLQALLDLGEPQATRLSIKDSELDIVVASNPAVLYHGGTKNASQGEFTSEVYDAGFISKWGRVHTKGNGSFSVEIRTGNTGNPDDGWSNWSKVNNGQVPGVPAGRYAQVKTTLGKNGKLDEIICPYIVLNQPPMITNLVVNGEGPNAQQQKNPRSNRSSNNPGRFNPERMPEHSSFKNISWTAESLDGDSLVYKLYYREEKGTIFKPIAPVEGIDDTHFRWDTSSMEDGYYIIKLVASDEKVNPPGMELTDFGVSDPFLVDNTRPGIKGLKVSGNLNVTGTAEDATSAIVYLAYSVDGGPWVMIYSTDGIFDWKEEDFSFQLKGLDKGPHTVSVMALDMTFNPASASAEFTVGR